MMIVRWALLTGPDASHLWNVSWFDRKKDALNAIEHQGPFILERHQWDSARNLYQDRIDVVMDERTGR